MTGFYARYYTGEKFYNLRFSDGKGTDLHTAFIANVSRENVERIVALLNRSSGYADTQIVDC